MTRESAAPGTSGERRARVLRLEPAPTRREIALSPEWLSSALGGAYPGVEIETASVVEEFTTLATKLRLALRLAPASAAGPASVFVKAFFGEAGRARAWIGEPEARFYSELAPGLGVRMPRALYAAVDPATRHGLVVLEDLVPGGARFLGALSPYSVEQVAATLGELAKLHARSWDAPRLEEDWLQPEVGKFTGYRSLAELQALLDGERGMRLPDEVRRAARLQDAVVRLFAATEGQRRCLVHGDAHAGNLYLDATGAPGIVDWQIVRRGHWSFDVAYHVAAALEASERERAERDLLADYLEQMRALGVGMPAWDEAWTWYRRALVYGYNLWAVATTVDPRITHEFVYRLGSAAARHGSMELLGV